MEEELAALRAVVFVPGGAEATRHRMECLEYCRRRRYELVAVAHTPAAVDQLWRDDRLDLVVVARPEHVRVLAHTVEVVTEQAGQLPRQRRARRLVAQPDPEELGPPG